MMNCAVIGSGLAGVFCALALLRAGHSVVVIDTHRLPVGGWERTVRSDAMRHPSLLADDLLISIPPSTRASGKLRFGSDHATCVRHSDGWDFSSDVGQPVSYASGGFSDVWGAATLRWHSDELAKWPVDQREIDDAYDFVESIIPSAGRIDELSAWLGHSHVDGALPTNQVITSLLESKPTNSSMRVGAARLAIRTTGNSACRGCSRCATGCPWGSVFSARDLHATISSQGARWWTGKKVVAVAGLRFGASVTLVSAEDTTPETFRFDKVFLAAGALSTTGIVLRSKGVTGVPLTCIDTQCFTVPVVGPPRDLGDHPGVGLAQAFLEYVPVTAPAVHGQLYGRNDIVRNAIEEVASKLRVPQFAARGVERRAYALHGFVHSDYSQRIRILLTDSGRFRVSRMPEEVSPSREVISAFLDAAHPVLRTGGFRMMRPLLHLEPLGSSYHIGGTFPMESRTSGHSTNEVGELEDLQNVHLVDGSVFPSIPPTTIGLTIAANAFRIATAVS
jgi:choline dehydrogenase-like flavoprotein